MEPTAQDLINKCQEFGHGWHDLVTPPFSVKEPIKVIQCLIQAAEMLISGEGLGGIKRYLVLEAYDILDEKYGYSSAIGKAIKLPFLVNLFSAKIVHAVVDVIITVTVNAFNLFVWKKVVGFIPIK